MNEYSDPYSKKIKRQALVDFIYLANPRIKIPTSIELDDLRGIAAQYVSKAKSQPSAQHDPHRRSTMPRACKSTAASGKSTSSESRQSASKATPPTNQTSGKRILTASRKPGNTGTSTTAKFSSIPSSDQSKHISRQTKKPSSSKRVVHQSSNNHSTDEQETGIEDCIRSELASESDESDLITEPSIPNKGRSAHKSLATHNPPEPNPYSNPNLPGLRNVVPRGPKPDIILKPKTRVSFDPLTIERSHPNTSSNNIPNPARLHTNPRNYPSESQHSSFTPNPGTYSSNSQQVLPATNHSTYPFDGRRNLTARNPGTYKSDIWPTSTNNRIVPDYTIRENNAGSSSHHSHKGVTSSKGVTDFHTGSTNHHSQEGLTPNRGSTNCCTGRNESQPFTSPKSKHTINQLSARDCLMLSELLTERINSINQRPTKQKVLSSKPPVYYPPMESDSERLWQTLSSRVAKKEEQLIHTLIPYQYDAPWLGLTGYQATQEELKAGYPTHSPTITPKWIALTDQPFSSPAELLPAPSNPTDNTSPANPSPASLSTSIASPSDSDKILQLLQQMTAVQHQAFSYLAGSSQNQHATSLFSAPSDQTQSASFSYLAQSPQNKAGTSSSSAHGNHTLSGFSAATNPLMVSPSAFSPLALNQSDRLHVSPGPNFQPPTAVQHTNQSVDPPANQFTFVPTATTRPSPIIPSIQVSPAKSEQGGSLGLQNVPISLRPISSLKQLKMLQPDNAGRSSNTQDPSENQTNAGHGLITKNQDFANSPKSLDKSKPSDEPKIENSVIKTQNFVESPNIVSKCEPSVEPKMGTLGTPQDSNDQNHAETSKSVEKSDMTKLDTESRTEDAQAPKDTVGQQCNETGLSGASKARYDNIKAQADKLKFKSNSPKED
ncbi:hypothetical protein H4Q26_012679 [Puccinia striiformis f. sp. tritici PST-130]|nr:hypothetical protein H4Q26_012679 [Puccinia striiformis f. sp. tritici PST-130]